MNPVLVEVHRNEFVESQHRGSAVVVNKQGDVLYSVGDINREIYPRSSLKFFQAIPFVESGAADAFGLSDKEISIACASHNGEKVHVEVVAKWLSTIGLSESDLENGPTYPLSESVARDLVGRGGNPSRLHQNCSGKHTGMLSYSVHSGHQIRGYSEFDHPSQIAWMEAMGEMVDLDLRKLRWEKDGCGLPALCMPMQKLALGCAVFATGFGTSGIRGKTFDRITRSIQAEPLMLAGTNRCCSRVVSHSKGQIVVKTGAEGVFSGYLPGKDIGFALKIDDGATRASEVALGALLKKISAFTPESSEQLSHYFSPNVVNSQGFTTGRVLPSDVWNE